MIVKVIGLVKIQHRGNFSKIAQSWIELFIGGGVMAVKVAAYNTVINNII
jgi:site-specific DNA-adenine methylase